MGPQTVRPDAHASHPSRSAHLARAAHPAYGTPLGLSPDAGWELEVERTLPLPIDEAWQRLVAEWLPGWLGVDSVPRMVGAPLLDRGTARGRVLGCHVGRRVRVRWTPSDLDHETIFQATLIPVSEGTQMVLHQERLLGAAERQALLNRWTAAVGRVARAIAVETGAIPIMPTDDARRD